MLDYSYLKPLFSGKLGKTLMTAEFKLIEENTKTILIPIEDAAPSNTLTRLHRLSSTKSMS